MLEGLRETRNVLIEFWPKGKVSNLGGKVVYWAIESGVKIEVGERGEAL